MIRQKLRVPLPLPLLRTLLGLGAALVTLEAAPRPNLIVILTDDQSCRAVGYENPEVRTPRIDALARGGMILTRAFAASPICAASRASLMTGLFPQQHGLIALQTAAFAPYRRGGTRAAQALAARLAEAGYATGFFGKSHLGAPTDYGFAAGREMGYDSAPMFAAAAEFVRAQRSADRPYFLWIAPHEPHVPLFPEPEWLERYPREAVSLPGNYRREPTGQSLNNQGLPGEQLHRDSAYRRNVGGVPAGPPRDEETMREFTRAYYAVTSRLDAEVGRFGDLLRETGELERTMVFFLSDNGYHLGSHGLGNKITMHEESVRIPCFVWGAGIPAGHRSDALVSSLDLYPTLLELAGAAPPPIAPAGLSLVPLLTRSAPWPREVVHSECVGVGGAAGQGHRMARDQRWKLVLSDADEEYLFDLAADPLELRNLRPDPAAAPALQRLRGALAGWMRRQHDRPYPPFP
ncbi:MAG: sulfatase [Opitutaceae bacterium]